MRIDEMSAPVKYVLLPAKQRKVLRFCTFHKFGKCKFGNRCDLIHDTRIQIPCVECKFGKSCWYSHGAGPLEEKVETHNGKNSTKHVQNSVSYEIMMEKVETAIGILQQDIQRDLLIQCHELQEQIHALQKLIQLQDQKICAISKETTTKDEPNETRTFKKSYFGTYEVYRKPPLTNISSPAEKDSRIITINVQKTSQPLGLKLAVCEEKQTVHVADIEKDKITEFCVGDRILHINGKHMSTVQNVMDIIGVVKTSEVIQFDVERSYEFQPNHCKNTHSLTLKKTRKKKQYNEKET